MVKDRFLKSVAKLGVFDQANRIEDLSGEFLI